MDRSPRALPTTRSRRSPPGTPRRSEDDERPRARFSSSASRPPPRPLCSAPALAQGAAPRVVVVGGGFAGASCARALGERRPTHRGDAGRGEPDFTACPFSNAVIAGLRELRAQQFTYEHVAADGITLARTAGHRRRRQARRSRSPTARGCPTTGWCSRPASISAGARCPATTRRPPRSAACLEGGRADAAAAPPARGDGRRRARRHLGAGQSVPLPARALRARQPDRALSEDEEAEVQADRARRQGHVLQAEAVPGRLGGAVPRPARVGAAVQGRQRHLGRRARPARWSPTSATTRRRSPTSSRRRRPAASPSWPASPIAPAGARSTR